MTDGGCPACGSAVFPVLVGAVTCTNSECERYNVGWVPGDS